MLDVDAYKQVEELDEAYEITVEDLEGAMKAQNVTITEGDVILIRTDWGKLWVHASQYLGGHIIENLNLEELSKSKNYTFTFIALPIPFVGAAGAQIRPVALVEN